MSPIPFDLLSFSPPQKCKFENFDEAFEEAKELDIRIIDICHANLYGKF